MADTVELNAGSGGAIIATDDVGGAHYQYVKPAFGANNTATIVSTSDPLPVVQTGTLNVGTVTTVTNGVLTLGYFTTVTVDVTRPSADATQYAVNDALSDSTSAPTSGGFTITNAARASGKSGIIQEMICTTSADQGTLPSLEVVIFDSSVTNINDNSAFAVSDAEAKTIIGTIPVTLEDFGNNGFGIARNLGMAFTTVGSANLRFLVRMKNAYTPVSATPGETFTFRFKILQID
jgi:hypothetical protein